MFLLRSIKAYLCPGAASGGAIAPPPHVFFFFFCLSAQSRMVIIPLPHYWRRKSVRVPPAERQAGAVLSETFCPPPKQTPWRCPCLCPNMINFDGVDFSERHSEEVIGFFWCSVLCLEYQEKSLMHCLGMPRRTVCHMFFLFRTCTKFNQNILILACTKASLIFKLWKNNFFGKMWLIKCYWNSWAATVCITGLKAPT